MARLLLAVCASVSLLGCASDARRVVLIPPIIFDNHGAPSDLLRIGAGVRAKVYFATANGGWELSANEVELPEGWLLMPPPPEKDGDGR